MKDLGCITLAVLLAAGISVRSHAQSTNAPLYLFTHGVGTVSPLQNGQMLEVGQSYQMLATPAPGFVFSSWQPFNLFIFTEFLTNQFGEPYSRVTTTASLLPEYTYQPLLEFIMQPMVPVFTAPDRTISVSSGWQANFVPEPIPLNIQLIDSSVILTWTNSAFFLQTAPSLTDTYTPILGATSPYTNSLAGPAQFFRLVFY